MSAPLQIVYQYRRLLAKCESSLGLTLEEIENFSNLEELLERPYEIEEAAHLRSKRFVDPVSVVAIGGAGALCDDCPFLEPGQVFELRFKAGDRSYRFATRVHSVRENSDDSYRAWLTFEGTPVLVRNTREFPLPALEATISRAA